MIRQMAKMQHEGLNHHCLRPSRSTKDDGDVKSLAEMLKDVWQSPFSLEPQDLFSIYTGASLSEEEISDLCNAQKTGKEANDEFVRMRLLKYHDTNFFGTVPHIKLRSFEIRRKKSAVSKSGKEVVLRADRNLFTMMAVVAQTQKLDMKIFF